VLRSLPFLLGFPPLLTVTGWKDVTLMLLFQDGKNILHCVRLKCTDHHWIEKNLNNRTYKNKILVAGEFYFRVLYHSFQNRACIILSLFNALHAAESIRQICVTFDQRTLREMDNMETFL